MADRAGALDRILELVVMLSDDMTRRLAADGLTTSRSAVLWHLHHNGPVPQRDLAEALHVTARTITGLVDGLEKTGFVTREPHPTDRRATLVTLTGKARKTVDTLEREQEGFVELLFGELTADRFDCFVAGLDHVLGKLRSAGLHPVLEEQ